MISVFLRIPAHYVYPQAFMQPSMMIPHVQPASAASAAASPYLDYTVLRTHSTAISIRTLPRGRRGLQSAAAAATGYGYVSSLWRLPDPRRPRSLNINRSSCRRTACNEKPTVYVYDCISQRNPCMFFMFGLLLLLLFYL